MVVRRFVKVSITPSGVIEELSSDSNGQLSIGVPVTGLTTDNLQGFDVSTATPVSGNVLAYNGLTWTPENPTGGSGEGGIADVVTYVTFSSTSDSYTAGTAIANGGVNDYVFAVWHRLKNGTNAGDLTPIVRALGAYEVVWNFGGLRIVFFDNAGNAVGPSNIGSNSGPYGHTLEKSRERDALIVGRITNGATTPQIETRVNGAQKAVNTAGVAGTPAVASSSLEVGGFGGLDPTYSTVEGFAYYIGTLTDLQLETFEYHCMISGGLVSGGVPWTHLWSHASGSPGATWTDLGTSGSNLTRNGTGVGSTIRRLLLGG